MHYSHFRVSCINDSSTLFYKDHHEDYNFNQPDIDIKMVTYFSGSKSSKSCRVLELVANVTDTEAGVIVNIYV